MGRGQEEKSDRARPGFMYSKSKTTATKKKGLLERHDDRPFAVPAPRPSPATQKKEETSRQNNFRQAKTLPFRVTQVVPVCKWCLVGLMKTKKVCDEYVSGKHPAGLLSAAQPPPRPACHRTIKNA